MIQIGFRLREGHTELHPMKAIREEALLGFEFDYIEDFNCRSYAILLIGNDRNIYYYDTDRDVEDELYLPRPQTLSTRNRPRQPRVYPC